MIKNLMNHFFENPIKLFLFDALGAVLSTILLGIVLVKLNELIGMPINVLQMLASLAAAYAIIGFGCYFFKVKNWKPWLCILAIANTLHCTITIYLLFVHQNSLTSLGYFYFILEIIIVLFIVYLELRTVKLG